MPSPVGVGTSPGATLTAPIVAEPTAVSVSARALTPVAGIPATPAAVTVRTVCAGIGLEYPPVPLRVSSRRPAAGMNKAPVPADAPARARPTRSAPDRRFTPYPAVGTDQETPCLGADTLLRGGALSEDSKLNLAVIECRHFGRFIRYPWVQAFHLQASSSAALPS